MLFEDKVVVITGGAQGIGKCTAGMFKEAGAHVCLIDIEDNPYYVGNIGNETALRDFTDKI